VRRAFAHSPFTRHAVLTAWAVIGAVVAVIAFVRGQSAVGALGIGTALGGLIVLIPFIFDPIPFPLSRAQWPMRLPILRRLAGRRHWANPFYVELMTLHSALRPDYCAQQLSAALIKFPWLPIQSESFAGWTKADRFVLKRITWWHNGMRPTAAGRFEDAPPGTDVVVWVAAPAVGAYFFLVLLIVVALLVLLAVYAVARRALEAGDSPTSLALVVLAGVLMTLVVTGLFASPIPIPLGRSRTEGDRYVTFFDDVLAATVIARE
jgi:hypothetical protein